MPVDTETLLDLADLQERPTPEQRIEEALQQIDGEIKMLTTRPGLLAVSLASAEFRLENLLNLREILLGKKGHEEDVAQAWRRMVRERWPEDVGRPGALGWCLYVMHSQEDEYEPVNHDAWVKDAQEITAVLKAR